MLRYCWPLNDTVTRTHLEFIKWIRSRPLNPTCRLIILTFSFDPHSSKKHKFVRTQVCCSCQKNKSLKDSFSIFLSSRCCCCHYLALISSSSSSSLSFRIISLGSMMAGELASFTSTKSSSRIWAHLSLKCNYESSFDPEAHGNRNCSTLFFKLPYLALTLVWRYMAWLGIIIFSTRWIRKSS